MKFKDIKPFIKEGNYEIDVFLDGLLENLERYDKDYGLELNPDFQRGHVWTEEQQISYVEFFLRGGRTARVIYFNSPAFGNEDRGDLNDTILCVDGLQRLTALTKFLRNEIKVFGYYFDEFEDRPSLRYTVKFNINSLKYRKEVLEWYVQFNSGGTVHSEEEIDRVKQMIEELEMEG